MTVDNCLQCEVAPSLACPSCDRSCLAVDDATFTRHFQGALGLVCPHCNAAFDLWNAVQTSIRSHFALAGAFQILGARTTYFTETIPPNIGTILRFEDKGVPSEAMLLAVDYRSQGGPLPLPVYHTGGRIDLWKKEVCVFGGAMPALASEAPALISVTWILVPPDDIALANLLEAARFYDSDMHQRLILPAHIAVEMSLEGALSQWAKRDSDKELRTLKKAAYCEQLKELLPHACQALGIRPPDNALVSALDQLRLARNALLHEGQPSSIVTRKIAADFLVGAIFGFFYCRYFRSAIVAASNV